MGTVYDMQALKAYVQGPSSQNKADDTVLLNVSHSNLKQRFMELRFDLHTSIEGVKERLRSHSGTAVESMVLQLLDESGKKVADLSDSGRPLGFYSPQDGYRIHIIDLDPQSHSVGGWLEDTSLVEKYQISEEAYNKREVTYRKFKETKLAQDPTWTLQKELAERNGEVYVPKEAPGPDHMADLAEGIKVGNRCEVDPGAKRGEVMFVGNNCKGLPPGYWVGVKYDEPVGKNDGSVKGERFFTCAPGYGGMLRPDKVKVGDYPEKDPFEDEDDEI
ncbi:Alpha-tubulin folding cofactor B [Klebsormidium nitens]|uniref:Alpha-tubulin folding cofactor B n=1 Tax=Klebsormidium nitens TaxID=105231 RepID=A0A1Y1HYY4_KLENI|nr:Alpha-tubulin folding cofactor B [Klebsormidium nitens]|eukprot:GAQ82952.1 Alpha-tubulin folding cofactor B [Klebsormidium nitens]